MEYEDFLLEIQNQFGVYPKNKKGQAHLAAAVYKYLKRDIDKSKLPILLIYIQYYHFHNNGVPGIAHIEYCIDKAIQNKKGGDVRKTRSLSETGNSIQKMIADYEEDMKDEDRVPVGTIQNLLKNIIKKNKIKEVVR